MKVEAKLRLLLAQGVENEIVEFKEAKKQYDFNKLGKYFSALSNEASLKGVPSAWLVFGIKDKDKSFVDTQYGVNPQHLISLKEKIANKTTNRITFIEIHELNLPEGRVLILDIPAAPKGIPIAWDGHYYGRDGEALVPLNLEELERIRLQVNQKDWSAQIIENATIEDLSPVAIAKARKLFKTKNPKLEKDIGDWDDAKFLNKSKVTIKGKITNAAILLLGKPESEHFLSPATSQMTWILKDKDNIEKDYAHFTCPLLISASEVYSKIRNLKYRYMRYDTLFPEEVDQYDPYIIREALNNCIAHQDYTLGHKIVVVENEEGTLIFSNAGTFIPESVENVVITDAPEYRYRNKFLANAMVSLNMIDTIGSGIKKMFLIQRKKYFPLPDYDIFNNRVKVTIIGKVIDLKYAQKLATAKDLTLLDIILLDKVAKRKLLTKEEIKTLRAKKLIEGRKPNVYISASIAEATGEEESYINMKGFDDSYYSDLIINYLKEFKKAKRVNIRTLLDKKLPEILDDNQKDNKIKNLLQKMKKEKRIKLGTDKCWYLDEI
ncbi:RNA-binding domain-containing protein [Aureispira sp. CCB-QB1]|uniref:RNA-binding domain-containing protein n=1 Tax=Aureispira sp. CCB-QB1 TaxID=1313421 RepID=UPI0006978E32|nr:RNA-binding domain-containing protein [Aureispira sp. CCB-QB1]